MEDYEDMVNTTVTARENDRDRVAGVMVYGGDTMGTASRFEALQSIFDELDTDMLKCIHGSGSPIDVLIGAMAGADLFCTEYPLALALKGKALMLKNPNDEHDMQENMISQKTLDD